MKYSKFYLFLLTLIACTHLTSASAKTSETTKLYSLGEVVVSDNKNSAQVNRKVEITSDEMEKKSIKTLDQALELLPGCDVRRGGNGVPRVNIHGFRSRHTILLLNGIPINSTYDQQFDPKLISTENISKIKVSYGTNSALYGQGGLAGVINIITKQGTEGIHLNATTEIIKGGNQFNKASVYGGKDKFDFFVSTTKNRSKGFYLSDHFDETQFETGETRENSDSKKLSFFGNFGYQVNEEVELGLTLERSTGEFGKPPSTISDTSDPFYSKPKYDRIEDFKTFSSQASISFDPKGLFSFRGWAFVNTYEEKEARYDDAYYEAMVKKNSFIDDTDIVIKGATIQSSVDFESMGGVTFSLSGQKDEYSSNLEKVLANNNPPTAFSNDYEINLYTFALEYKINLFSKLNFVTGYNHFLHEREIGDNDRKAGYMAGLSYNLFEDTSLRTSYARKIRFPSVKQLYDSTSGENSLRPEKSKNFEAGISQNLPWDMNLDLSVFSSDVEDYIEKNDTTNINENNQEYIFKGFDIRLAKKIFENGMVGITYSFLKTKDKSDGTLRDELQYRPINKIYIDANYTFDFGLTVSADYIHTSRQYHYSDTFQKGRLNAYSLINLRFEQKLWKDNLSIYIGADNLLDEDYEESYGFPQAGRTTYAGLNVKF